MSDAPRDCCEHDRPPPGAMPRARRRCALLSCRRLASAALAGVVALVVPAAPAMAGPVTADPLTAEPVTVGTMPLAEPVNPLVGDQVRGDEWYLRSLNIQGAWTYASGAGVTVAVIDSGVDA